MPKGAIFINLLVAVSIFEIMAYFDDKTYFDKILKKK